MQWWVSATGIITSGINMAMKAIATRSNGVIGGANMCVHVGLSVSSAHNSYRKLAHYI